jgi:hypothetical protein
VTREPFGSATSEFARSAGAVGISHGAAAASAQGVDGAASASATASSTAGDAIAFAAASWKFFFAPAPKPAPRWCGARRGVVAPEDAAFARARHPRPPFSERRSASFVFIGGARAAAALARGANIVSATRTLARSRCEDLATPWARRVPRARGVIRASRAAESRCATSFSAFGCFLPLKIGQSRFAVDPPS